MEHIPDKYDVTLTYNYILDNGLCEEKGGSLGRDEEGAWWWLALCCWYFGGSFGLVLRLWDVFIIDEILTPVLKRLEELKFGAVKEGWGKLL